MTEGTTTQGPPQPDVSRGVQNFVHRQICVSVSMLEPIDPEVLYATVREWLNQAIPPLIPSTRPTRPSTVDLELEPFGLTDLAVRFAGRPWIEPRSIRTPGGSIPDPRSHMVVFDPVRARSKPLSTDALLFYSTGFDTFDSIEGEADADLIVRRLVNLINRSLRGQPGQPWWITAASPHWLTAASGWHSCGGPGGKPEPVARGSLPSFAAETFDLGTLQRAAAAGGAVVAVLDTCPDLNDKRRSDLGVKYAKALLGSALDGPQYLSVDDAIPWRVLGTEPYRPRWYGPEMPAWTSYADPDVEFDVADHGVFVAGIVRQIAPWADIRLIRVLGKYGVGDMAALVSTMRAIVPDLLAANTDAPLVVNMSLMVDDPASTRAAGRWVGDAPDAVEHMTAQECDRLHDALVWTHYPLRVAIDWLIRERVMLIGAAGNDHLPREQRALPRFPARYPGVFSVAALGLNDQPAAYSNQAADGDSNGIAVFGGDGDVAAPWDGASIPAPAPVDLDSTGHPLYGPRLVAAGPDPAQPEMGANAVRGLFTAQRFPLDRYPDGVFAAFAPANVSGLAVWSGTSFAAPVISGLAANILGDPANASLSPEDVRVQIQGYASSYSGELGCGVLRIQQTGPATL